MGGQRGDPDRLQRLPIKIIEGGIEAVVAKDHSLLFIAIDADVTDFRHGIAEALHQDVVGITSAIRHAIAVLVAGIGVTLVGNNEATIRHGGHGGPVLGATRTRIDQDLAIHRLAGGVVLLHENVVAAACAEVVGPGDHPTTILESGYGGIGLGAVHRGVDPELRAKRIACVIETLSIDPGGRKILSLGIPHHDEAAALQRRNLGVILRAGDV